MKYAPIVQLKERLNTNQVVVGLNPTGSTKKRYPHSLMVELHSLKVKVDSPSLSGGTLFTLR